MALVEGSPSVILKSVAKLIQQKVPTKTAHLLEQFSNLLYGNISSLDLEHRNESDMYGATLSLWNSLNTKMIAQLLKCLIHKFQNMVGNQVIPLLK